MEIANGTRGLYAYFAYSLVGLGDTPVPQLNVTLEILNPKLAGKDRADANGFAQIIRPVPANMGGRTVWIQAAEDGRRSNVDEQKVQ